jgi:hypothetical protein
MFFACGKCLNHPTGMSNDNSFDKTWLPVPLIPVVPAEFYGFLRKGYSPLRQKPYPDKKPTMGIEAVLQGLKPSV